MVFNLLVPEFNSKPKGTKDAIINILLEKWPLNIREIFYTIKNKYGYSHSYQAVFNGVTELKNLKVLKGINKKYELNVSWIKKLQSFTDIVETNYYAKDKAQTFSGVKESKKAGDIQILTFETILDMEKYLYYFIKDNLLKDDKYSVYSKIPHEWRPNIYFRAEYNFYQKFIKKGHKFNSIFSGASPLEKKSHSFYRSLGVTCTISKRKFNDHIISFGDYFIQVFIPEKLKILMEQALKKRDLLNLIKGVLERKDSVRVIITRDASISKDVQKSLQKIMDRSG